MKTLLAVIFIMFYSTAYAVDMSIIYTIESSNNPKAHNIKTDARGLGQITPIVLKEWNMFNVRQYKSSDLFNEVVNKEISTWYMQKRIPQMLRHFKLADTTKNRLICYNAGISYARKGITPKETREYIRKYEKEANKN